MLVNHALQVSINTATQNQQQAKHLTQWAEFDWTNIISRSPLANISLNSESRLYAPLHTRSHSKYSSTLCVGVCMHKCIKVHC